jgi:hypothetical protein
MIESGHLTSLLVKDQLPEYIRDNDEYVKFHTFIKAYYEWMEQTGKVTERTKNLLTYKDVDTTTEEFLDYFTNDFLPFFPKETLLSKEETIKVARQLYQTKGTPASYEFLFRILFNSDFEVFNTKEAVFKASAGTWYVSKSLKLASNNGNFLNTKNLRVFGLNSKSIATIEAAVLVGDKTEIFISNIERLFESGEYIKIVDSYNQDVLFDGEILTAKIVGQISQIKVDSVKRGALYQPGDPVVVYDGMEDPTRGIGASAIVSETTKGSLQRINVVNGGFGYSLKPNTVVTIINGGGAKANVYSLTDYLPPSYTIVNGGSGYKVNDRVTYNDAAFAYVSSVSSNGAITGIKYVPSVNARAILSLTGVVQSSNLLASGAVITTAPAPGNAKATVSFLNTDIIGYKSNTVIGNSQFFFANLASANANTKLINALSFATLETSSIYSMTVDFGGGGIASLPDIQVVSTISTEDITNQYASTADIASLGILAPIQIVSGGKSYQANDKIIFTGGSGTGAYANVTSVGANGTITGVSYVYNPADTIVKYPLGGSGYKNEYLPSVTVQAANNQASGAVLTVPGILGTGATFSLVVDRVGSVTTIGLDNFGEDYSSQPGVSLKVQDIVVSNVAIENLPRKGEYIYQGPTINLSTYTARVNSVSLLQPDANSQLSLYNLQVFNYNANPNPNLTLKILGQDRNINLKMANSAFPQFTKSYTYFDATGNRTVFKRAYNKQGYISYGDGSAKANATFLNGLVIGNGQYLTSQGQPSSFDIMQNDRYNNFTYLITVDREISRYREVLLGLLHPLGTQLLGRYGLKSNNSVNQHVYTATNKANTLSHYIGSYVSDAVTIVTDFTNKSNNIIRFNSLLGANLANIVYPGLSSIYIQSKNGPNVYSEVVSIDPVANTITLASNVWLTYANVATATGNSGSNVLNITSVTGLYDIVNNGNYSDKKYPLKDIVYSGDVVLVDNNTSKVVNTVDYTHGKIYLTSNLTSAANSYLAVKRTFVANSSLSSSQIKIFGAVGTAYIPELTTEDGVTITTEDGTTILLG